MPVPAGRGVQGTGTSERVGAAAAVLEHLVRRAPGVAHVVLTTTHDDELVELLHDSYTPFHLATHTEGPSPGFEYTLRAGRTARRNAIELLAANGAPPSLLARS